MAATSCLAAGMVGVSSASAASAAPVEKAQTAHEKPIKCYKKKGNVFVCQKWKEKRQGSKVIYVPISVTVPAQPGGTTPGGTTPGGTTPGGTTPGGTTPGADKIDLGKIFTGKLDSGTLGDKGNIGGKIDLGS
ncbi:hypothetical protein ACPCIY_26285 [Streptomyces thermodiastaticus]